MNAEITKIQEIADLQGWVLFDGNCPFCCSCAERLERILTRRGFDLAPLQASWLNECLGLGVPEIPGEMLVLTTNGQLHAGADALLYLARRIWWARPIAFLGRLPPLYHLMVKAYRLIAANRMCLGGACPVLKP